MKNVFFIFLLFWSSNACSPTAQEYLDRGVAKGKLGDHRGAIADFNKLIELDPGDASAYYNRGVSKHKLGDKNGACLDWSKAGELGLGEAYEPIREYCN